MLRCSDCTTYVYDMDTGERKTYEDGEGSELPILRATPPPCDTCPKRSPREEPLFRLTRKNARLVDLYRRSRATPGFDLPKHLQNDQMLQDCFAVISELERESDRWKTEHGLRSLVIALVSRR